MSEDVAPCHEWRAKIKAEDPESLYEQTGDWHTCAIGKALDLADLEGLDNAVHEVDVELYKAAYDLDDLIQDGGVPDMLKQLDHIEKLIAEHGGPAVLRERIRELADTTKGKHP